MNTRNLTLALLIFTATLLTGCGPSLGIGESANEMGENAYSFYQQIDSNYVCPSSENITPPDDRVMDGTQHYVACTHRSNAAKIKVIGYSSTSRMICAFPVQYLSEERFVYKLDSAGQPMYRCYDGWNTEHSQELEFTYTNFNGVLIADQSLRPQMSTALVSGGVLPMHAIGKFR